ncbi:hypothetical protein C0995_001655 [Termitomyces sp. Mi166|nr:hypothetical protein C0995_001655 [Termitomyces sp. Mi166\
MNTNGKTGELEATLMKTSMHAVNLKALLTDDSNLSGTVLNLIISMEAIEQKDAWGSHLAYLLDPTLPDFVINSNTLPIELSDDHL